MQKQKVTVTVLSLALIVALAVIAYLLYNQNATGKAIGNNVNKTGRSILEIKSIGPVDEGDAQKNIDAFRQTGTTEEMKTGLGVAYTQAELRYYVDTVYPALISAQERYMTGAGTSLANHEWKIGCYWTLNKDADDDQDKFDFFLAPVSINTTDKRQSYDFFASANNKYMKGINITIPAMGGQGTTNLKSSVFNTGTMFP